MSMKQDEARLTSTPAIGKPFAVQNAIHFCAVMSPPEVDAPIRARPLLPSARHDVAGTFQPLGRLVAAAAAADTLDE